MTAPGVEAIGEEAGHAVLDDADVGAHGGGDAGTRCGHVLDELVAALALLPDSTLQRHDADVDLGEVTGLGLLGPGPEVGRHAGNLHRPGADDAQAGIARPADVGERPADHVEVALVAGGPDPADDDRVAGLARAGIAGIG